LNKKENRKEKHAFVNTSPIILNFDLCGFEEEKGK